MVDGVFHAYLYVTGYGYATTVGSCWLAPLVEAGEGINISFIFKRQPKDKILSKITQTTMVNRSRMRDVERKSRRNALTSGVAAAFPFASYELSDRNGIFLGLSLQPLSGIS